MHTQDVHVMSNALGDNIEPTVKETAGREDEISESEWVLHGRAPSQAQTTEPAENDASAHALNTELDFDELFVDAVDAPLAPEAANAVDAQLAPRLRLRNERRCSISKVDLEISLDHVSRWPSALAHEGNEAVNQAAHGSHQLHQQPQLRTNPSTPPPTPAPEIPVPPESGAARRGNRARTVAKHLHNNAV
jgi:hypothetical protein